MLDADDVRGRDAHVGEEHLVELVRAGHLHERAHLDARRSHVDDEVRDAAVRFGVRVGAGEQDAEARHVRKRCPDLLAVHDELVAVAHGTRRQACEVAARGRLAEQLAPDLRPVEDARQPLRALLVGAGDQQRRPGPADADRVDWSRHAQLAHHLVDLELFSG